MAQLTPEQDKVFQSVWKYLAGKQEETDDEAVLRVPETELIAAIKEDSGATEEVVTEAIEILIREKFLRRDSGDILPVDCD